MKKKLLIGFLVTYSCLIQAQRFYPSGNLDVPTWAFEDIVGNNGSYTNPKTELYGDAISDAELDFVLFFSGDAYDGAFEFFINVEDSVYTDSGKLTDGVDTVGTTFTLAEQLIDSFYVSKQYYFSPLEPAVRATFKIRNPYPNERSTKVGILTNMGSDGATLVDTCSTGGEFLTDADRWMVTTDGYENGDPINTWVRFGPGSVLSSPVFGSKPEEGNDDYLDTLMVSVPSNSYVLIMQFSRMDSSIAAARENIAKFNTVDSLKETDYLSGMTDEELAKVVNWDFSSIYCEPTTVDNPQSICENDSYIFNGHTYTLPGNYNDTLQGALGCDSIVVTHLTVNLIDTTEIAAAICDGDSYNFHGTPLTSAGTFYHTLTNIKACDSVIVLALTVNTVDLTTTVKTDTIYANQLGATYQWIDCDNGNSNIEGKTSRWFKVTESGNYAVKVTKGACSEASECQSMTITGVESALSDMTQINISPNPSEGVFVVNAQGVKAIKVINVSGQVVYHTSNADIKSIVDITSQSAGIYMMQVTTEKGTSQHLIIKE
jgi:hypothetical protein